MKTKRFFEVGETVNTEYGELRIISSPASGQFYCAEYVADDSGDLVFTGECRYLTTNELRKEEVIL